MFITETKMDTETNSITALPGTKATAVNQFNYLIIKSGIVVQINTLRLKTFSYEAPVKTIENCGYDSLNRAILTKGITSLYNGTATIKNAKENHDPESSWQTQTGMVIGQEVYHNKETAQSFGIDLNF